MANIRLELSCVEGSLSGARCLKTFEERERISVWDSLAKSVQTVSVNQISLYRHTVLIEGNSFQIIQIFK
jgi:hypothetical protein